MMTQVEEYLEQRKKYSEAYKIARNLANDKNASEEEQMQAKRESSTLRSRIKELDIQIRALDPNALKPTRKRVCRGNLVRLDMQGERNRSLWNKIGVSDNYKMDPTSPVVEWMNEAVRQLHPRHAQAIDLYFNKGLSCARCAEVMGVSSHSMVARYIKRGLKYIQYWIKVRTLVTKCALSSPFDWDRFLDEMDILTPRQLDILLTLLDCKEGELTTPNEIIKYCRLGTSFAAYMKRLKGVLTAIGIPEEEINRVHPIFKRYQPQVRTYRVYQLVINASRAATKR